MFMTISYQDTDNLTQVKEYRNIDPLSLEFFNDKLQFKHFGSFQPYTVNVNTINAVVLEDLKQ